MAAPLSLLYFPSAIALGALHALEPGHAKTLTAAYLIGTKGTKRDAILLGLSVAATHSIVVIGMAVAALWLGKETLTDQWMHWLQLVSGVVVVLLGTWMLWRRLSLIARIKRIKAEAQQHVHHHGAPDPFVFNFGLAQGVLEIVNTPHGERFRMSVERASFVLKATVKIMRDNGSVEEYELVPGVSSPNSFDSSVAPEEPHEFSAVLVLTAGETSEALSFKMAEPVGHSHDHGHDHSHEHGDHGHNHADMDDDEHARAHSATLPEYVKTGERPTLGQIVAFGAAGGMIPCPASVTVMLLALSVGQTGMGFLTVLGFSLGLAITLVGIGLMVVTGLTQLAAGGRMSWLGQQAPIISAIMVILSGVFALCFAH